MLGADFFLRHIAYFDYGDSSVYIGAKFTNCLQKRSRAKIPVEFTELGQPVIEISFLDKKIKTMIDTGSSFEFSIPRRMSCFNKSESIRQATSLNYKGEGTPVEIYSLPSLTIHGNELTNILVSVGKKENVTTIDSLTMKRVGSVKREGLGVLGYPLFYRTNILFDFPNSGLHFIEPNKLHKLGIRLAQLTAIPFELTEIGMVLAVETDFGMLRLLLDTGTSKTLIHERVMKEKEGYTDELGNSCTQTEKFALGSVDYGEQKIYLWDIEVFDGVDGILGMDFLRKYPFYVDYHKRVIHFGFHSFYPDDEHHNQGMQERAAQN